MNTQNISLKRLTHRGKFQDRYLTADGQERASVPLVAASTLWFNTGTLCNIECVNCYIESSPTNNALSYLSVSDMAPYLDELTTRRWPVNEIGFTGGEPFMNPAMIDMMELALKRGFEVLILTNAMRPMMRARVRNGLERLNRRHPGKLTLRVSLDHYTSEKNDAIRGDGSFDTALKGLMWLRDAAIQLAVAGRKLWDETDAESREGYRALFQKLDLPVDARNPAKLVLFPEMDAHVDVPEITTACWNILSKRPDSVMCASSRMIVKRRGADQAVVLACTLLPYEPEFELGTTLEQAERPVHLNHPHCAKFCVLGGASCSG